LSAKTSVLISSPIHPPTEVGGYEKRNPLKQAKQKSYELQVARPKKILVLQLSTHNPQLS